MGFDQKAEEAAAAAAAGETLERGSFFAAAGGEAERRRRRRGAARKAADLADDERQAAARVRAMQAVLKAYLSDSPEFVDTPPFPRTRFDYRGRLPRLPPLLCWRRRLRRRFGFRYEPTCSSHPLAIRPGVWIRTVASPPCISPASGLGGAAAQPSWRRLPSSGGGANLTVEEASGAAREDLRESAREPPPRLRRRSEGGRDARERGGGVAGPGSREPHLGHRAAAAKEGEAAPRARAARCSRLRTRLSCRRRCEPRASRVTRAVHLRQRGERPRVDHVEAEDEAGARRQPAGRAARALDGAASSALATTR